MQEKLSVQKVYANSCRYVARHMVAFIFLTGFYFLGSLLPMIIGATSFRMLMLPYYYLFLYFAAGFYYKQQILWDKRIFFSAGLRFLTAILLFLAAILLSNFAINFFLDFLRASFGGGKLLVQIILKSTAWLIGKYIFIFLLFISFFVVPSFAFVSEITGKSRSLLTTYVKTKGNMLRIGFVAAIAFILLLVTMITLTLVSPFVAEFARTVILVFITLVYFKMYDFFYKSHIKISEPEPLVVDPIEASDDILLAKENGTRKKIDNAEVDFS